MRTTVKSRGMLLGLALLATAGMTACTTRSAGTVAGPGNSQTTTPAATAAASPATKSPGVTPTGAGGGVRNLAISTAEKSELSATYLAFRGGISLSDLAGDGPTPGSVYYAYDPATNTYWALAVFEASRSAPLDVQIGFQDGGSIAMYRKTGASPWQAVNPGVPPFCGEAKFFPKTVLTAWGMPTTAPAGLTC